ncbi:Bifunctional purine biosynthetic protein ade1, partial [Peltigera leucophlebia]|nr:Bifunctional purine biosynthetic protein ade1 [Peltigera leucophlebia]
MKNGIPLKGALLTSLSEFWFKLLQSLIPTLRTHFISLSLPPKLSETLPPPIISQLQQRCMQTRRLKVFPIEAIVRGYITGSAWKEYTEKGTVHGIRVSGPNGTKLVESQAFEEPLYTPSTKAEAGAKDENIHPDQAAAVVGEKFANRIEQLSLEIYDKVYPFSLYLSLSLSLSLQNDQTKPQTFQARLYALSRGIIIADTKFEFGLDPSNDEVILIDEVLTPDSSRFWPLATYLPGSPQESFDKQHLRDWLTENKLRGVEGVEVPDDVVKKTGG